MKSNREKLSELLNEMGNTHTLQDILDRIADGRMQSFAVNESWAVTQITEMPRKKLLDIFLVVGELKDIDELQASVVSFAKETGCDIIRTFGRLGWKPTVDKCGWSARKYHAYILELN